MLAQFSVENFLSFKEKAVLNLTASRTDDEHPDNYVDCGKLRCLRSVMIYGANASGKSNLLEAVDAAVMLVRESQSMQVDDWMTRIVPFRFDDESSSKPSAFEFVIIIDGIRYVYGFSATQREIVDEYLYVYRTARPSMIFERTNTTNYRYNKLDSKEFLEYEKKTTANKLFLATATAWNCEKTRAVYLWFSEGVDTDTVDDTPVKLNRMKKYDTPERIAFTLRLLNNADINIDSYEIESRSVDKMPKEIQDMFSALDLSGSFYRVTTCHTLPDNRRFYLDLSDESLGTRDLFHMSPVLFEVFDKGKTLFVDEMSSLHPLLVEYIIKLFLDPEINRKNAQLIFVTHDISLLSLKHFRRDQVYFVDKNEYGISELYALDDFSVRKKENIRTAYLLGRYGAIPHIGNGEIL